MKRRELRERIFEILFRVEFMNEKEMEEQMELFFEDLAEAKPADVDYIKNKYLAVREKMPMIDIMIDEKSKGWKTSRMGKVELTILRLAVYEMLFDEDVPSTVAINEAVELAKKFSSDEAPAFINGVLGKAAQAYSRDSVPNLVRGIIPLYPCLQTHFMVLRYPLGALPLASGFAAMGFQGDDPLGGSLRVKPSRKGV
jgi:N utilization substance protein B